MVSRILLGVDAMRYLISIFLGCSVVFGFLAYYYHARATSYCELWKKSQANINLLIKQRKKDYEDTLAISERNKELEKAAAKDKAYFDWNADIANTAVVKRLQAN